MSVYIAIGGNFESTDNLGVFDDYEDALQRCRNETTKSDIKWSDTRFWIETWEFGAAESVDVHEVTPTELVAKAAQ